MPRLTLPGGGRIAPITAGLVGAIAAVSFVAILAPMLGAWLMTPVGALPGLVGLWQMWRPFTAALVASGPIQILLTVVFTYWCGADLERSVSRQRYGFIIVASALGAAATAACLPSIGLIGTAWSLAWGLVGAGTLRAWRRGANIQQQLVILLLLLLMSMSMGGVVWLISVGALLGGAAVVAIEHYLPAQRRRPDDWSRRRQPQDKRVTVALVGLCLGLLALWMVPQLLASAV